MSSDPGRVTRRQGVITLDARTVHRLRVLGPVGALAGAALLAGATVTIGVPRSPQGDGLRPFMAEPIHLGLAALMGTAGLLAIRWRAVGAFLMAVAAGGLGLAASVEYRPALSFALAALLIVPAVLTWLAWQSRETVGSIAVLATVTASTLTGTAFGSREVYRHYYGPTHPASSAEPLTSVAGWLWLGGVTDAEATVVAGDLRSGSVAVLHYWASGETVEATVEDEVDEYGLARFALGGLAANTDYR